MGLRNLVLQNASNKTYKECEWQGEKFLIKKPTMNERQEILKKSNNGEDTSLLSWFFALNCVVDVETKKPIFDGSEKKEVLEEEAGGFLDYIIQLVPDLLTPAEDVETIKKP